MATLVDYRGLKILTPDPTGRGGMAIQEDLKLLADRVAATAYVEGLELAHGGVTTLSVAPGKALSADGATDIEVLSPLSVDIAATGSNGLDAGTAAPGTVYFVFVIADSGATLPAAGLASLSQIPALPAGFDRFRRVGAVATGANGELLRFRQTGSGRQRRCFFGEDRARTTVLSGGSATSFQDVDLASFVPATAGSVVLSTGFANNAPTGGTTDRAAFLRAAGDVHDGSLYALTATAGAAFPELGQLQMPCSRDRRIEYRVSNALAELTLAVVGFEDAL